MENILQLLQAKIPRLIKTILINHKVEHSFLEQGDVKSDICQFLWKFMDDLVDVEKFLGYLFSRP
jgi:hypothetical protein